VHADGRSLRPDLVVRMPGGRNVVVDAKAPLHAFLDAYETTDEARRAQGLAAHARLVREHVRALSAKSYWAQFGDRTPDFVFLFLPGEHFLNAALEADPSLIEEGVDQSVLIATPTTLIALLRAVGYGWRQEQLTAGAREVAALGRELHDRLGTLAQHVDTLGRRLGSTVEAYNGAVGSLEGRVLVTARRLADHGAVSAGRGLPTVSPVGTVARAVHAPEADDRRLDLAEGARNDVDRAAG
jgi:DNA recombination protein RmuC